MSGTLPTLSGASVVDFGKVIFSGSVNVNPTLTRIRNGNRETRAANDGTIFQNAQGKLPRKSAGYYREFVVVPMRKNASGRPVAYPGPERVVMKRAFSQAILPPVRHRDPAPRPLLPERSPKSFLAGRRCAWNCG